MFSSLLSSLKKKPYPSSHPAITGKRANSQKRETKKFFSFFVFPNRRKERSLLIIDYINLVRFWIFGFFELLFFFWFSSNFFVFSFSFALSFALSFLSFLSLPKMLRAKVNEKNLLLLFRFKTTQQRNPLLSLSSSLSSPLSSLRSLSSLSSPSPLPSLSLNFSQPSSLSPSSLSLSPLSPSLFSLSRSFSSSQRDCAPRDSETKLSEKYQVLNFFLIIFQIFS